MRDGEADMTYFRTPSGAAMLVNVKPAANHTAGGDQSGNTIAPQPNLPPAGQANALTYDVPPEE